MFDLTVPPVAKQIIHVVRQGLIDHRGRCAWVVLLGLIGTVAQAGALLALIPIIRHASSSGTASPDGGSSEYILYIVGVTLLFIVSVRARYMVFSQAFSLSGRFAAECAEKVFKCLQRTGIPVEVSPAIVRNMVNRGLFRITMGCSVLFRQVLLSLNEVMLLVVFIIVLFYISPTATIVILLLSTPLAVLYIRSYETIAAQAEEIDQHRGRSRDEINQLVAALRDRETTPDDVGGLVRRIFISGYAGEALFKHLSMRRTMKGSSAVMELVTPVSIVVIATLLYFSADLGFELATILTYYIVLRHAIAAVNQITESLIMVTRVYPDLRDYARIINEPETYPGAWVRSLNNGRDDPADSDKQ